MYIHFRDLHILLRLFLRTLGGSQEIYVFMCLFLMALLLVSHSEIHIDRSTGLNFSVATIYSHPFRSSSDRCYPEQIALEFELVHYK